MGVFGHITIPVWLKETMQNLLRVAVPHLVKAHTLLSGSEPYSWPGNLGQKFTTYQYLISLHGPFPEFDPMAFDNPLWGFSLCWGLELKKTDGASKTKTAYNQA